jgi:hypothetical protein
MDVDRRGSSPTISLDSQSTPVLSRRSKAIYQFTQQSLPACKPVLTPAWVITTLFLIGAFFIPVGLIALHISQSVVEIVDRYDTECIPEIYRGSKQDYIKDISLTKNCTRYLKVPKHMKAPIYIYYQLDNYYQNHRRYVKSRSDQQLLHGDKKGDTGSCKPEDTNNGLPVVPCGLIAWSLFNDTYTLFRGTHKLKVNRKNISWESDRLHKFGKNVYPFNFQNGTLIGGANLDPHIPLQDQEDLIVWMRTAALPSFRKLYGRIEEDLVMDDIVTIHLFNNYNTYSFGGAKKIVLSTSSWLGGRNNFLGLACVFVGSSSVIIAFIFMLLHVKTPRSYGETAY